MAVSFSPLYAGSPIFRVLVDGAKVGFVTRERRGSVTIWSAESGKKARQIFYSRAAAADYLAR